MVNFLHNHYKRRMVIFVTIKNKIIIIKIYIQRKKVLTNAKGESLILAYLDFGG